MTGILQPTTGTPTQDYLWPQGADLVVSMVVETGPEGAQVGEDLTGAALRMDVVTPTGDLVYTFNTEDEDPATVDEVTLGADGSVNITVPRSLTLPPDGAVYTLMTGTPPVVTFSYDVFLRRSNNRQEKLLRGTITIEPSHTLWA